MKRFDLYENRKGRAWMEEREDGDYVNYEDHVLALMAQDKLLAARGTTIAAQDARIAELEADRRVLQSTGEHPAPCALHCEANAFRIELRNKDARIAQLEAALAQLQLHYHAAAELHPGDGVRIAELEKQAAIDKTLLALADARINRELRDDFAGRAMQGLLARPGGGYTPAMAYAMADEMLKAKGGT